MSEEPKIWRLADKVAPKKEWGDAERIERIASVLATRGVTDIEIYSGGTEFVFEYKNRLIGFTIQWKSRDRPYVIFATVFSDKEEWGRYKKGAGLKKSDFGRFYYETIEKPDNEEQIRTAIEKILGNIN